MTTHDNIAIPTDSFPNWIWFGIEAAIVFAISMVFAMLITDSIQGLEPNIQNWVFYGIFGFEFFIWYIVIRGWILKKPILENRS